jgi:lipopolysaccharide biosynthesis protein
MADIPVRLIAFYLPQYHPIPENDHWWGKGFTEWTNVTKAKPLFRGHYQPHLPADLGFYDLRVPEVREAQATLARKHGIYGFCYHHYWFHGSRLLHRPFAEVLDSGRPDFPFCLCWANENWTRVWDGKDRDVLLAQTYSRDDDLSHIRALIPAFRDPRYIRIQNKPLFLVYRIERLPDPRRTAAVWRNEASRAGIDGLFLAAVESFTSDIEPAATGFDGTVEFAPNWAVSGAPRFRGRKRYELLRKIGVIPRVYYEHSVFEYQAMADQMLRRPQPLHKCFLGVMPSWDNTPRRPKNAYIFHGSTPQGYESWLSAAVQRTSERFSGDERIVFINAWNEWGEGCHLEPDQRWGRAYLEATSRALKTDLFPERQPVKLAFLGSARR